MTDDAGADRKIVVAVNKRLERGPAANALAHAMLGLAAVEGTELEVVDFKTSDDGGFLGSALPLIVLRAQASHLRRLRTDLRAAGLPNVAFHEEMIGGRWTEQVERSSRRSGADIELFAVASLGESDRIDPLTRRLRLY